ncbi:unnamed protein product [Amoebophrya sp. A25]|nr:unnamed protein product [Amoebophrya sp. A25]|eukprot:GSA25T00027126001.1
MFVGGVEPFPEVHENSCGSSREMENSVENRSNTSTTSAGDHGTSMSTGICGSGAVLGGSSSSSSSRTWLCQQCTTWIAMEEERCPVCSMWEAPKPKRQRLPTPQRDGQKGREKGREKGMQRRGAGSWHCADCYYDNFPDRTTCNKCLKPREACEGKGACGVEGESANGATAKKCTTTVVATTVAAAGSDMGIKRKLPDPSRAMLDYDPALPDPFTAKGKGKGKAGLRSLAALLGNNKLDIADLERIFASSKELREAAAAQGIYDVHQLQSALVAIVRQQASSMASNRKDTYNRGKGGARSGVHETLRMTDSGHVVPVDKSSSRTSTIEDVEHLNTLFRDSSTNSAGTSPEIAKVKEEKMLYEGILQKLKENKEEEDYDFDAFGPSEKCPLADHPELENYGINGPEHTTLLKFWSGSSRKEAEICPRFHVLEAGEWRCAGCGGDNRNQDRICTHCDEIRETTQWFCRHSCTWQPNVVGDAEKVEMCAVCKKPRTRCEATPEMEVFRIFGYRHEESEEGTTYEDLVHGMVCVMKRILKRYSIMEEKERCLANGG